MGSRRQDRAERFKRGMRAAYDGAASGYDDRIRPTFEPIARAVIELANPAPHERHLDLATGSGLVLRLLDRHRDDPSHPTPTRSIGVDLSAEMLGRARLASSRAAFVQADLEQLPFRTAVADVVTLALALHHLPSPQAALVEARRTLRPGGRLAIAAWAGETSPLWQAFDRWFEAARLGPSRPTQQSDSPLDRPELLRLALLEAGFSRATVTVGRFSPALATLEAFWEWRTSFAATQRALAARSPRERAAHRVDCLATLSSRGMPDPRAGGADQDVMLAHAD